MRLNPLAYKHLDRWVGRHVFPEEGRWRPDPGRPVDVYLSVCDHYEPEAEHADPETALARVGRWADEYPRLLGGFADHEGRPPQHTCFFPQDQYRPEYLDRLKGLVDAGFADVDVHLHHDGDTAESLTEKLAGFRDDLWNRHGLLRRDDRGRVVYGFIHGNWALCNSRDDGRWCGVNEELTVLMETGCYADFTMPSAPSTTQTPTINSIYYAKDTPGERRGHFRGVRARVGQRPPGDRLLMVQGPLTLDWRSRKFGLLPRTENADVHANLPPTVGRFENWLNTGVHVAGEPNRVFVKLHTHGCKPGNIERWLGPSLPAFHRDLAERVRRSDGRLRLHYVTAWETARLVHEIERRSTLTPPRSRTREVPPRESAAT